MEVRRFFAGDAPKLRWQLLELGENDELVAPDITGWTVYITMTPRTRGSRTIKGMCFIVDAGSGIVGFDITGGRMPYEPLPQQSALNSFSQPTVYDGRLYVRTLSPDASAGEVLTSEAFTIIVQKRQ